MLTRWPRGGGPTTPSGLALVAIVLAIVSLTVGMLLLFRMLVSMPVSQALREARGHSKHTSMPLVGDDMMRDGVDIVGSHQEVANTLIQGENRKTGDRQSLDPPKCLDGGSFIDLYEAVSGSWGSDHDTAWASDGARCMSRCNSKPRCAGFMYDERTNRCKQLYGDPAAAVPLEKVSPHGVTHLRARKSALDEC